MSDNDIISIDNEHSLNFRSNSYPENLKEFVAEFLGTTVLVFFCLSAAAQSKFISKDDPKSSDHLTAPLAGGIGASLAILLVGKISGAHLNPAVSFGWYLKSKLKFVQFLIYVVAQFLGAFIAAFLVFILYYSALDNYENDRSLDTAKIFTTFPTENIGILTTLFDQILGTAYLVMVIFALNDKKIADTSHSFVALFIGLTLFVLGSTMGYNCGAPVNPARDFSPRLFIFISGWSNAFISDNLYFLVPLFGPMLGAFLTSIVYILFISNNLD